MIHFIKILPYQIYTSLDTTERFKRACKILSQETNPQSLHPKELDPKTDLIYYSPLKRSVECIDRKPGKTYTTMSQLQEIPFNITLKISQKDFEDLGSQAVRTAFVELFLEDRLSISRARLFSEIKSMLKIFKTKPNDISAVSHSFRMKIIEAYIATQGSIETNPKLIHHYIFPDSKTYEFGTGFSI